jgi:murein DD-endopeptidase MepM/ murein hydrolase activator NlpD
MADYPNPNDPRNWPSAQAMRAYIFNKAKAAGLDPNKTVRIAELESKGFTEFVGDHGKSGGPFQLFTGGGLGNLFEKLFGGSPLDPRTVWNQIDFAIGQLKAGEWRQWTTARNANIDPRVIDSSGGGSTSILDYIFPVQGYKGSVQLHHGENGGAADLFAPEGTAVFAMKGGTITGKGNDKLGGNWWMIRGLDGLDYYYAHLKDMTGLGVGDHVDTGQTLGTVGDTGNAKGTGAHLHIGIGHGINSGAGPAGGSGIGFDAVGLLRSTLAAVGSAWSDPYGTGSAIVGSGAGIVDGIAGAVTGGLVSALSGALQTAGVGIFKSIWQVTANWFEDRASALIFLAFAGIFILLGLAGMAFSKGKTVVKTVGPMVVKSAAMAAV